MLDEARLGFLAEQLDGPPYTVLSCSMSIDGYIDDATGERLLLSNDTDFDRVDAVRAECDAIMVGASTVRQDNPRLQVRSRTRREWRMARGQRPSPIKVILTRGAKLDPCARLFARGGSPTLVYCETPAVPLARQRLGDVATVIDGGNPVEIQDVVLDLRGRGVDRLMVEGGRSVLTQFLTGGLADELQLAIAPLFVGDARAPRLVDDGSYPWCPERRAILAEVRQIGDVAMLRYALSNRFAR